MSRFLWDKGEMGHCLGEGSRKQSMEVSTGATNIGVISSEGVAEVEKSLDTSEGRKKTILGTHSVHKNEKCHGDSNSCSATSIIATVPRTDRSFRLRKPPTKFPPLEVLGGFPPPLPLTMFSSQEFRIDNDPKVKTRNHRKGDSGF